MVFGEPGCRYRAEWQQTSYLDTTKLHGAFPVQGQCLPSTAVARYCDRTAVVLGQQEATLLRHLGRLMRLTDTSDTITSTLLSKLLMHC